MAKCSSSMPLNNRFALWLQVQAQKEILHGSILIFYHLFYTQILNTYNSSIDFYRLNFKTSKFSDYYIFDMCFMQFYAHSSFYGTYANSIKFSRSLLQHISTLYLKSSTIEKKKINFFLNFLYSTILGMIPV